MILIAGGLLALAVGATLVAGRVRVPGLLLFLGLGMAVGTDGLGWIDLTDVRLARTIGVIALALILYEGGLDASFREIRPVLPTGLSLAGTGTVITAFITGAVATAILGVSLLEGLLLGSIVATTDAAAIFSVLRTSRLKRRLAHALAAHRQGVPRRARLGQPDRPVRHPRPARRPEQARLRRRGLARDRGGPDPRLAPRRGAGRDAGGATQRARGVAARRRRP